MAVSAILLLVHVSTTTAARVEVLLRVRIAHRWLWDHVLGARAGSVRGSHARRVHDVPCAATTGAVFGFVGFANEAFADDAAIGVPGGYGSVVNAYGIRGDGGMVGWSGSS